MHHRRRTVINGIPAVVANRDHIGVRSRAPIKIIAAGAPADLVTAGAQANLVVARAAIHPVAGAGRFLAQPVIRARIGPGDHIITATCRHQLGGRAAQVDRVGAIAASHILNHPLGANLITIQSVGVGLGDSSRRVNGCTGGANLVGLLDMQGAVGIPVGQEPRRQRQRRIAK